MMVLCTYSLEECSAPDILDVVKNHEFALLKRKGAWELIESSEHKKAEEALKEIEYRYRFLTENMNDLVWIIDLGFRTTYVNPSVEKVLGFTTKERMAQTPEEQVTPETLEMAYKVLAEELQRDTKNPGSTPTGQDPLSSTTTTRTARQDVLRL